MVAANLNKKSKIWSIFQIILVLHSLNRTSVRKNSIRKMPKWISSNCRPTSKVAMSSAHQLFLKHNVRENESFSTTTTDYQWKNTSDEAAVGSILPVPGTRSSPNRLVHKHLPTQGVDFQHKKKETILSWFPILGGKWGIQTPDTRKGYTGFRVQRIRSLCQLSNDAMAYKPFAIAKVIQKLDTTKRIVGNLRILFESKLLQAIS